MAVPGTRAPCGFTAMCDCASAENSKMLPFVSGSTIVSTEGIRSMSL